MEDQAASAIDSDLPLLPAANYSTATCYDLLRLSTLRLEIVMRTSNTRAGPPSRSASNGWPRQKGKIDGMSSTADSPDVEHLVVNDERLNHLGLSAETLRHFGAGLASDGPLRERLVIPVHTEAGQLLGFVGVALDDAKPYLRFTEGLEGRPVVFNAHRIRPSERISLYKDILTVLFRFQEGESNAVSMFGSEFTGSKLAALNHFLERTNVSSVSFK